ncbi:hypothetical protein BDF20DRAFT_481539 [Mycotypha africana]|uniref:uncharacterized protein n=1 Tax=Mycotypha africana TaxID=64632 RepID=UPI0022FFD821|nr:uncharacterized protein BDF20DRAFT_481539 [Mycotypha africana]KAI8979133.1 hypothetical protein BDF20DRAFT_481539 [Mycotypha africana]
MKISKGNLTITMYYVDLNIGLELYDMLQLTASQPVGYMAANSSTTNAAITFQPVILLTMHPAVGGFLSAWEFTLIIVVVLLGISFLASVGMHWHLWRIRRRQRAFTFENGLLNMDPNYIDQTSFNQQQQQQQQTEKKLIDPKQLHLFSSRTIASEQQYLPVKTIDTTFSSSLNQLEKIDTQLSPRRSVALNEASDNTINKETAQVLAEKETDDAALVTTACVICLDEFVIGDEVRQLPCHHEYHCECIGNEAPNQMYVLPL